MFSYHSHLTKHCRWCGKPYSAKKPVDRDGFCKAACKQAHYRAYKNYVTAKSQRPAQPAARRVTRKKR